MFEVQRLFFEVFTFPIMRILETGDAFKDDSFNFFFSLMLAIGLVIFIPAAIFAIVGLSSRE